MSIGVALKLRNLQDDVDDMIQRRLVENNLRKDIGSEEVQWPQEFCLVE